MPRARRNTARVSLEAARWRLGTLWFVGSGVIFLILVVQTLTGVYEDRVEGVWGWAFPNFLPTLMMMMGVFAAAAIAPEVDADRLSVRRNFLRLATGLSAFHLLCLLLTLLIRPLLPGLNNNGQIEPMALFETSNLFLGPLQGLVGGAIGALFFSKAEVKPAES